jgi:catalase-peroxidase
MGPHVRYLGSEVPQDDLIWQDPVPKADYAPIDARDIAQLKAKILASGLTSPELVRTAWASAATFRGTINNPPELTKVLARLDGIQKDFNKSAGGGKKVSMADLIVLGGSAAVESAAKSAGYTVEVPFTPGRTDALQAQTDVVSFAALEPTADGFRD